MIKHLRRIWWCVLLGRHDLRPVTVFTRPLTPAEVPEGREYRHDGPSPTPTLIDLPNCRRCAAVLWYADWRNR